MMIKLAKTSTAFDPALFSTIQKAQAVIGAKNGAIRLAAPGTNEPMRVEFAQDRALTGTFMPVRWSVAAGA